MTFYICIKPEDETKQDIQFVEQLHIQWNAVCENKQNKNGLKCYIFLKHIKYTN